MSKTTKLLSLDLLTIDGGTQSRLRINEDTVEEYHDDILEANGEWPFPPIDVFHDGSTYFVADGFHRFHAANRAKRGGAPCRIHKGTAFDARIYGMTANDKNGLRMTREDKRACVEWLLDNGGKMTQKAIAEAAGVAVSTVRNVVADRNPVSISQEKANRTTGGPKGKLPFDPPGDGRKAIGEDPLNPGDFLPDGEDGRTDSDGQDAQESDSRPPRNGRDKPADFICPNCGHDEADDDGDCAKCHEPGAEVPVVETSRETKLFQCKGCLKQWMETVRKMMSDPIGIDSFREEFPGPAGDRAINAAKELYESLQAWKKVVK